jgi:ABC-2 type transport system permease protein
VVRYVNSDAEMNDMIVGGKARVGIKIPVDYSDKLLHQMSAQVLVLIDGSDSSVAGQAINVTTAIGLDESLRRVLVNNTPLPWTCAPSCSSIPTRARLISFFPA